MGQKKLVRFAAIKTFANVLQYPEGMKGGWKDFFKNEGGITLELACGKGEYSTGLGAQHPQRNFIGVDIKGNRIYIGARKALSDGLHNVAFLRAQIGGICEYFAEDEVEEIWIIFPDPFLRKAKNRLTHARFLALYQKILAKGGRINLKTDSAELFDFTMDTIEEQGCHLHESIIDIYAKGTPDGPLAIQTHYEGLHRAEGRTIYFVSFSLPEHPIVILTKKEAATDGEDD